MIYVRHKTASRWCAADPHGNTPGDEAREGSRQIVTACGRAWPRHELEVADEVPPLVDRCKGCEPAAPVLVGLRELAACAIEVSFDCYERLVAVGDVRGVPLEVAASDAIDRALDEEMASS